MKLTLHIEKLVIEGFPRINEERMSDVVRRELARHLETSGFASACTRSLSISRLDAGEFRMESATDTESLGRHAAGAMHRALSRMSPAGADGTSHPQAGPPRLHGTDHARRP